LLSASFIWKVAAPDEVFVVVVGLTVSAIVEMDAVRVVTEETLLLLKLVEEAGWDTSDEIGMALVSFFFTLPRGGGFGYVVTSGWLSTRMAEAGVLVTARGAFSGTRLLMALAPETWRKTCTTNGNKR